MLNKIDLPAADPDGGRAARSSTSSAAASTTCCASRPRPASASARCSTPCASASRRPRATSTAPARALVFDSTYDQYRGVIAFVRVVDGALTAGDEIDRPAEHGAHADRGDRRHDARHAADPDARRPARSATSSRASRTSPRSASATRFTHERGGATEPLPGYLDVKPMVFAGLFPTDADDYQDLRDALEKLKLNDASLIYEPETSQALGFGFRCGFLGLLHMEVVRERLEREFDLDLLVTTPNVAYEVHTTHGARRGAQPVADARRERDRGDARALREGLADRAQGVRRHGHGAGAGAPRRVRPHGVPLADARAAHLPAAAGRDRARLLRPAQEPHARATRRSTTSSRATARRTSSSSTSC